MSTLSPEARAMFDHACAVGEMPKQQSYSCRELLDYCAAEEAWQATLAPHDPRHKRMFEIMREGKEHWVRLWWSGHAYDWDLGRIDEPNDLVQMLAHVGKKTWPHSTGQRIARLIEAVYRAKGWDLHNFKTGACG